MVFSVVFHVVCFMLGFRLCYVFLCLFVLMLCCVSM